MQTEKVLTVEVVSPRQTVYADARVSYVSAPAAEGEIGVLPGHMPLVSTLNPGVVRISEKEGRSFKMKISGGFVEVKGDRVLVLAEEAAEIQE